MNTASKSQIVLENIPEVEIVLSVSPRLMRWHRHDSASQGQVWLAFSESSSTCRLSQTPAHTSKYLPEHRLHAKPLQR